MYSNNNVVEPTLSLNVAKRVSAPMRSANRGAPVTVTLSLNLNCTVIASPPRKLP